VTYASGIADGKSPKAKVRNVHDAGRKICYVDQEVRGELASNMAARPLRRLTGLSRGKRLFGILSLCDIAISDELPTLPSRALCGIYGPPTACRNLRPPSEAPTFKCGVSNPRRGNLAQSAAHYCSPPIAHKKTRADTGRRRMIYPPAPSPPR